MGEIKRVKLKEDPRAKRKEDCVKKLCSIKATRKERKKKNWEARTLSLREMRYRLKTFTPYFTIKTLRTGPMLAEPG